MAPRSLALVAGASLLTGCSQSKANAFTAFVVQLLTLVGLSITFAAMLGLTLVLYAKNAGPTGFRIAGALTLALLLIGLMLVLPMAMDHPDGWLCIFVNRPRGDPGPGWANVALVALHVLLSGHLLFQAASRRDPLDAALAELESDPRGDDGSS